MASNTRTGRPKVIAVAQLAVASVVTALAACGGAPSAVSPSSPHATMRGGSPAGAATSTAASGPAKPARSAGPAGAGRRIPPGALTPFTTGTYPGQGEWHPAGRRVDGQPAVYETTLLPPGGTKPSGLAWMDTSLLSARLYSGSVSPGGVGYKFSAPVTRAAARTLVAAFNGGFKMADAHGGYYTEGRLVDRLVPGAASLVINRDGTATVGAWGTDVTMSASVTAVRQNLVPLVAGGRPTAAAASSDWQAWGNTCGAYSCAASVPGIEHQWRSGLGVTASGALVYAAGQGLDPLQLAQLLVRAGVRRGMELDINPSWPVFAAYKPPAAAGEAAPSNGARLVGTHLGPQVFFQVSYARDFITMSARP